MSAAQSGPCANGSRLAIQSVRATVAPRAVNSAAIRFGCLAFSASSMLNLTRRLLL